MKKSILLLLFGVGLASFCLPAEAFTKAGLAIDPPKKDSLEHFEVAADRWPADSEADFEHLEREMREKREPLASRLTDVKTALSNPCNRTPAIGFDLLWEKSQLEDALESLEAEAELKQTKLKYRKSIDIVKALSEKILSMDHHFSSLKAQRQALQLSNPHQYPEFKEARELIGDRVKKKFAFELPALLNTNPYVSAAFSIVGMVVGGITGDKEKKAVDVEKIACILDFTVQMQNDLSVIFYETEYLRDANLNLKTECEALFLESSRQVGYTIPLETCRDSDDWERLFALLDHLVSKFLGEGQTGGKADAAAVQKNLTNLKFAVDRVIRFIDKYVQFVAQGNDYYRKFEKIIGGYENAQTCASALPLEFKQLKDDIHSTIEKFNSAYRLPEMQGSRLKDLLYGGAAN